MLIRGCRQVVNAVSSVCTILVSKAEFGQWFVAFSKGAKQIERPHGRPIRGVNLPNYFVRGGSATRPAKNARLPGLLGSSSKRPRVISGTAVVSPASALRPSRSKNRVLLPECRVTVVHYLWDSACSLSQLSLL
jgi:hypothetical protein